MLVRQHGGRHEHGHLLVVSESLERRPHRHLGLAEPDIAAYQSVHDLRRFHVALDVPGRGGLVFGGRVSERVFELALPVAIRGIREVPAELALGVKLEQVVGHVQQARPHLPLGALPCLAAHAVQGRIGPAGAVILMHQVQPR